MMFNAPRHVISLILLSFGMIFLSLIFSIISDKHFSADGVNYFTIILETDDFTYIDWPRYFAQYITEFPLILASYTNIKDLPTLRLIFGIGLLLPFFATFVLSLFALRNENKSIMILMMISMASINLSSDYMLVGEYHVMALLAWPILFFLLRKNALLWYDAALLWILLFMFSRLYQTALIPAALFFLLGLVRLTYSNSYKQKRIFEVAIVLSAVVIAISAYHIIYPRSVTNKEDFSRAIIKAFLYPETVVSIAFTVLLFLGWILRKHYAVWAAVIPVSGYAIYAVWTGHSLSAGQSFGMRTLTLTLLPILMLMAVGIKWKEYSAEFNVAIVSTIFVATISLANVYNTYQWRQFKTQMKIVLKEESGLVPIRKTGLLDFPQRWAWNNSQLSIAWSDGCVRSVLLNPENVRWQPEGPPETFLLKEYTCYTRDFLQYDPNLCLCDK